MASLLILTIFCPFLLTNGEFLSFDDAAGTVSLTISQGKLLGKRIDAYENRTGYGFLGVPFGQPPVGNLRFSKPLPASSWEGVRNVTVKGDACPAVGELTYKRPEGGPMSEDCLHAYVYTPKSCLLKGGCAIMWVLHGGRYNFESPVVFVDEVIVHNFASDEQDVVVIIPAYRLSNFGFLNLAPGMKTSATPNSAVWDVLLALQWTHREAHHFGGDPNKITVFGHSAGAMFTDIISVSPHFDGLFRAGVVMSGADTAYKSGGKALLVGNSRASWVSAKILGCADDSTNQKDVAAIEEVIACLRAKTWEEIVAANRKLNNHPEDYHGPHMDGPGGILPLAPNKLAKTRRPIPMMIGTVTAEFHGTNYAVNATGNGGDLYKVSELCEAMAYGTGYAHPDTMSKLCTEHYMPGREAINIEQDLCFFMPTHETCRTLTKKGNKVYLYSFTYKGIGDAFKKFMANMVEEDHPGHSEDYVYIIGMHRGNFTEKDYKIEKIYSGMVLNFVKTGYPYPGDGQPKWKPFTKLGRDYYEIDFDENLKMPGMKKNYQAAALEMWADNAEKYGGPITDPEDFPIHADRFFPMDITVAYASYHLNKSVAHDKTLETEVDNYRSWTEYINNRRFKHLQGLKNFRSIAVEQPVNLADVVEQESNNIMEILIICVSAILIFLLLRCCLHFVGICQERKGYEEF